MDYLEAKSYLDSFVNFEKTIPHAAQRKSMDLSRVHELSARLGDPHRNFPSIHVAGTKGKGSCCAFVASMLRVAGLKVGLYTSPHLLELRERIKVNGKEIPEHTFAQLLHKAQPHLEEMRVLPTGRRRPTYFEIFTHIAFDYFSAEKVDVAILEVGLGGRLDATNIVLPEVCGITNISYDHTAILGETLGEIAGEKAGIIKPGVPVVSAPQEPEAGLAIQKIAQKLSAPLEFVAVNRIGSGLEDSDAELKAADGTVLARARLGLRGGFQKENWAVAVRLAQIFMQRSRGIALSESAIAKGSFEVQWPGRLEVMPHETGKPIRVLDGAHNTHSLLSVLSELRRLYPYPNPRTVLFACARDKDVRGMLDALKLAGVQVVFTTNGQARGCPPEELATRWIEKGGTCEAIDDIEAAWKRAEQSAGTRGLVLATGSLYLVGALKNILTERAAQESPASST